MILLFFAFLVGLVWFYIEHTFKDDISKQAIIPGVKTILIIFATILILVDCFMFVETNRLVDAQSQSNGTCVSYTGSDMKFPTSVNTTVGSYLSGTQSSFDFANDGDVYTVIEQASTPGGEIYLNYTDITSFTTIYFRGQAEGMYAVDILDVAGAWHTIYAFGATNGSMVSNVISIANSTPYINSTNTTIRVTQTDAGNISHRLVMDWLALDQRTTYTAYCTTTEDTMYIFIYHRMETDMMMVLLSLLPYIALACGAFISIQVVLLIKWHLDKNRGDDTDG